MRLKHRIWNCSKN